MRKITLLFISFLFVSFNAISQLSTFDDTKVLANLKAHITYLASNKLEGRETGKKGEELASKYIIEQFKKLGLEPKGTSGYIQEFPFTEGVEYGKSTALAINGKSYERGKDWFPLAYSANGSVKGDLVKVGFGLIAPSMNYNDYKDKNNLQGKIFIMELSSPDGMTPHSKYKDYSDMRTKIDTAISRGASAIIFVNSDTTADNPKGDFSNKTTPSKIPVVFANSSLATLLNSTATNGSISIDIKRLSHTGHNIIGYIDNGAKTTVVLGAHYDHLGYGGEGSGSLYRGEKAIHPGADDNGSGTAALLEMARYLKSSNIKNNNYLICSFSGEEKGLLGSNYYAKNPTIPLASMNYMVNMDMVGRLKPDEKNLSIQGTGTSPIWHSLVDTIKRDGIKVKTTESGIGPSDFTSFYLKDIPVIFFFTGSHNDYHKPTDTEDKINYPGELSVMKIIINVMEALNDKGKLAFTKTKEENNDETPRFKVTLGVVPDYAYEGEGMRIDGISDGKPAAKAGLKAGDIVTQMDEIKVTDMMSYMKALSKFKKGDTVNLKVKRGAEIKDIKATF
ncbi:MAG: M20/M25/M40 family metallo-hydrolase [Bacteroidota bacterium]